MTKKKQFFENVLLKDIFKKKIDVFLNAFYKVLWTIIKNIKNTYQNFVLLVNE